ncbi:hypothetical protein T484DRAFT_1599468, partial [Baffinella frigidus]
QGMSASQFFLYGKKHFTQTGYVNHAAKYTKTEQLEKLNLAGKVFVVTGANSGIGREIAQFLFRQNGRVYMVCRDAGRAAKARLEIIADTSHRDEDLVTVVADCSLKADVQRVASTLGRLEPAGVDALVCNAGALLSERTLTKDGVEATFACHLLYGAYGLAKVMEPLLRASAARGGTPRCVFVSSGGMYTTKWPTWEVGSSSAVVGVKEGEGEVPKYDGQLAYAYCKRAQVRRKPHTETPTSKQIKNVSYVSAHPGWTGTPGLVAVYGDKGAGGVCWLSAAPKRVVGGAFYLDRRPQVR